MRLRCGCVNTCWRTHMWTSVIVGVAVSTRVEESIIYELLRVAGCVNMWQRTHMWTSATTVLCSHVSFHKMLFYFTKYEYRLRWFYSTKCNFIPLKVIFIPTKDVFWNIIFAWTIGQTWQNLQKRCPDLYLNFRPTKCLLSWKLIHKKHDFLMAFANLPTKIRAIIENNNLPKLQCWKCF